MAEAFLCFYQWGRVCVYVYGAPTANTKCINANLTYVLHHCCCRPANPSHQQSVFCVRADFLLFPHRRRHRSSSCINPWLIARARFVPRVLYFALAQWKWIYLFCKKNVRSWARMRWINAKWQPAWEKVSFNDFAKYVTLVLLSRVFNIWCMWAEVCLFEFVWFYSGV